MKSDLAVKMKEALFFLTGLRPEDKMVEEWIEGKDVDSLQSWVSFSDKVPSLISNIAILDAAYVIAREGSKDMRYLKRYVYTLLDYREMEVSSYRSLGEMMERFSHQSKILLTYEDSDCFNEVVENDLIESDINKHGHAFLKHEYTNGGWDYKIERHIV